jgi:hypothetical protein
LIVLVLVSVRGLLMGEETEDDDEEDWTTAFNSYPGLTLPEPGALFLSFAPP